jgi:hypothetical protein
MATKVCGLRVFAGAEWKYPLTAEISQSGRRGIKMKIGTLCLFVVIAIPMCASNLVVNGDFSVDCSGWSTSQVFSDFCQNGTGGLGAGNPGGFAVLNNNPGLVPAMSQNIAGLIVGQTYQLSWDMESAYHCCGSSTTPGASAAIDGNTWSFIVLNHQGWLSYSQSFTYTGTSNVLSFMSQVNGTDTDAGIDNIVLTANTSLVPESGTLGLMATGILSFGSTIRRKMNR